MCVHKADMTSPVMNTKEFLWQLDIIKDKITEVIIHDATGWRCNDQPKSCRRSPENMHDTVITVCAVKWNVDIIVIMIVSCQSYAHPLNIMLRFGLGLQ